MSAKYEKLLITFLHCLTAYNCDNAGPWPSVFKWYGLIRCARIFLNMNIHEKLDVISRAIVENLAWDDGVRRRASVEILSLQLQHVSATQR